MLSKYIIVEKVLPDSEWARCGAVYATQEIIADCITKLNNASDRIHLAHQLNYALEDNEPIPDANVRLQYQQAVSPDNRRLWANTLWLHNDEWTADDFDIVSDAFMLMTSTDATKWQQQYITADVRQQWLENLQSPYDFLSK